MDGMKKYMLKICRVCFCIVDISTLSANDLFGIRMAGVTSLDYNNYLQKMNLNSF